MIEDSFESHPERVNAAMISKLTGIPLTEVLKENGKLMSRVSVKSIFKGWDVNKRGALHRYDILPMLSNEHLIDNLIDLGIFKSSLKGAIKSDSVLKKRIGIETESDGRQHDLTGEGFLVWLSLKTWNYHKYKSEYKKLSKEKNLEEGIEDYDFLAELMSQQTKASLLTFMNGLLSDYGQHIPRLRDAYLRWLEFLTNDHLKEKEFEYGELEDSWKNDQNIQSLDDMFHMRTFNDIALDRQLEILLDTLIEKLYKTQLKGNLDPDLNIQDIDDFRARFLTNNYKIKSEFAKLLRFTDGDWGNIR